MGTEVSLCSVSCMPLPFAGADAQEGPAAVGMDDADILVFAPTTIADKATYEDANQPAVGVRTVPVNGGFVVQNSEQIVDAPHGQPIRRSVSTN